MRTISTRALPWEGGRREKDAKGKKYDGCCISPEPTTQAKKKRTEDALDRASRRQHRGYYWIVPYRLLAAALARHGGTASHDLISFSEFRRMGEVWRCGGSSVILIY